MFLFFVYFQFFIVLCFFVAAPISALRLGSSYKLFGILFVELCISQLFMYAPGVDVSPYAFTNLSLYPENIAGLTIAAFTSITIIWLICLCFLNKKFTMTINDLIIILLAMIPNIMAVLRGKDLMDSLNGSLKIVAPFLIFVYLKNIIDEKNVAWFEKIINLTNYIIVFQVYVCKLFYGHFSAHNYYYELEEEFFGYYNHPHAFSGMIIFYALWNVYQINKGVKKKLNLFLFLSSVIFIFLTGARTYMVALAAGLLIIGVSALKKKSLKKIRAYVYFALICALLFTPFVFNYILGMRDIDDPTSGRLERWASNLSAMFDSGIFTIFLGGGIGFVEEVNRVILNYRVNSLNIFIDFFLDYGLIGLIMLIIAYYKMFRLTYTKSLDVFQISVIVTFIVASFINNVTIYIQTMVLMIILLSVIKTENTISLEKEKIK